MVVQLSTRKSIRWLPDDATEPTSTLVFNVGDYFVHLRINKVDESVDWGMAGKRAILSTQPCKCSCVSLRSSQVWLTRTIVKFQWTKEICSMGTENVDDVAVFELLPNGDAFETGTMPHPDNNNEMQAFEEVWGPLPVLPSDQPAWILCGKSDNGIAYLARVGDHYQALKKSPAGSFSVLREEIVGDVWKMQYAIDSSVLPSILKLGEGAFDARSWSVGMDVSLDGLNYSVLAIEQILW